MKLGTTEQFEARVIRYGVSALYSDGHAMPEEAFKHALLGGHRAENIEVVRTRCERVRVVPSNADVTGLAPEGD